MQPPCEGHLNPIDSCIEKLANVIVRLAYVSYAFLGLIAVYERFRVRSHKRISNSSRIPHEYTM